ncbi:hypothetical protein [Rugosimonospora acidiphila]
MEPDSAKRRASGQPPTPPAASPAHTGGSLTRVTANFTPRAAASLERIAEKTGDSRTDVLNMAVMAYETILELIEEGDGRTLRVQLPNGEVRVLQFIG